MTRSLKRRVEKMEGSRGMDRELDPGQIEWLRETLKEEGKDLVALPRPDRREYKRTMKRLTLLIDKVRTKAGLRGSLPFNSDELAKRQLEPDEFQEWLTGWERMLNLSEKARRIRFPHYEEYLQ